MIQSFKSLHRISKPKLGVGNCDFAESIFTLLSIRNISRYDTLDSNIHDGILYKTKGQKN